MVYLIHFDRKFHHARHYIGYTNDLERRIKEHDSKNGGAAILRAVKAAGIGYSVVRIWPEANGNFERKLKNRKKSADLCPVCNPDSWQRRGTE